MPDIIVAKRVIDWVGLNVDNPLERRMLLFKELQPVLSLIQGMGSDGAKLVSVDANGNLQVTTAGSAAVNPFNLAQVAGLPVSTIVGGGTIDAGNILLGGGGREWAKAISSVGDAAVSSGVMAVAGILFNNAAFDRMRSASAANLAAQSGLGVALSAPPGQWSLENFAGIGSQTSTSRVAGGVGIRHVLTGYSVVVSSQVAPAAGQLIINIRDGLSGTGTILSQLVIELPAAVYQPVVITRSGLAIVGSANTGMTIEQSAAYAAVGVSISLEGYDAS